MGSSAASSSCTNDLSVSGLGLLPRTQDVDFASSGAAWAPASPEILVHCQRDLIRVRVVGSQHIRLRCAGMNLHVHLRPGTSHVRNEEAGHPVQYAVGTAGRPQHRAISSHTSCVRERQQPIAIHNSQEAVKMAMSTQHRASVPIMHA